MGGGSGRGGVVLCTYFNRYNKGEYVWARDRTYVTIWADWKEEKEVKGDGNG